MDSSRPGAANHSTAAAQSANAPTIQQCSFMEHDNLRDARNIERRSSRRVSFADTYQVQEFVHVPMLGTSTEDSEGGHLSRQTDHATEMVYQLTEQSSILRQEESILTNEPNKLLMGDIQYLPLPAETSSEDSQGLTFAGHTSEKPRKALATLAANATQYLEDMSLDQSMYVVDAFEKDSDAVYKPAHLWREAKTIHFANADADMEMTCTHVDPLHPETSPKLSLDDVLKTLCPTNRQSLDRLKDENNDFGLLTEVSVLRSGPSLGENGDTNATLNLENVSTFFARNACLPVCSTSKPWKYAADVVAKDPLLSSSKVSGVVMEPLDSCSKATAVYGEISLQSSSRPINNTNDPVTTLNVCTNVDNMQINDSEKDGNQLCHTNASSDASIRNLQEEVVHRHPLASNHHSLELHSEQRSTEDLLQQLQDQQSFNPEFIEKGIIKEHVIEKHVIEKHIIESDFIKKDFIEQDFVEVATTNNKEISNEKVATPENVEMCSQKVDAMENVEMSCPEFAATNVETSIENEAPLTNAETSIQKIVTEDVKSVHSETFTLGKGDVGQSEATGFECSPMPGTSDNCHMYSTLTDVELADVSLPEISNLDATAKSLRNEDTEMSLAIEPSYVRAIKAPVKAGPAASVSVRRASSVQQRLLGLEMLGLRPLVTNNTTTTTTTTKTADPETSCSGTSDLTLTPEVLNRSPAVSVRTQEPISETRDCGDTILDSCCEATADALVAIEVQSLVAYADGLIRDFERAFRVLDRLSAEIPTADECAASDAVDAVIEVREIELKARREKLSLADKDVKAQRVKANKLEVLVEQAKAAKAAAEEEQRRLESVPGLHCFIEYNIHEWSPTTVHVSYLDGTVHYEFSVTALASTSPASVQTGDVSRVERRIEPSWYTYGHNPYAKFALDYMLRSHDEAEVLQTCTATAGRYDVKEALQAISMTSANTRMLFYDLECIQIHHRITFNNDSVTFEYVDFDKMIHFTISFRLTPRAYPDEPLPVTFKSFIGDVRESLVLATVSTVKPGPLYLKRTMAKLREVITSEDD